MRTLANFLTSMILAIWIGAIAILSVQNYTPVALRFFNFQSFEMPVGLVLAFSVGLGLVGTAIAQPLLGFSNNSEDLDDEDE
jgi:uncharacterized integral membrane protein